ncbi:hypothetical protein Tco_0831320 [Tanacetum coccineum]
MCRRQGYMIRDMERKCVTTDKFWKVHGKVDQVLHEIVPQLTERATNDLIEGNLKRVVADTVIQEQDTFQAEVPALISKEFDMKSNPLDQANDPALWDVLKQVLRQNNQTKITTYVSKQQHQQWVWDAWEEGLVIDEDEVIPKDKTLELITEFQNVDKRIPIIFDHARMEATLDDMLKNQFRNAERMMPLEQATNLYGESESLGKKRREDIR